MKPFNFVAVTGDTIPAALQLLKDDIDRHYADKACKIQQINITPLAVPVTTVAATPNGQPQIKLVFNVVALVDEEPEFDSLQRNYKQVFDFVNLNREQIMPVLLTWLQSMGFEKKE